MQPLVVQSTYSDSTISPLQIKIFDEASYLLPWHQHDTYELNYIARGSGQRIIGNKIDVFNAGDILLLGPGLPHAWKSHASPDAEGIKAITLKFSKGFPSQGFFDIPELSPVVRLLEKSRCAVVIPDTLKPRLIKELESLPGKPPARQLIITLDILLTISEHETATLLPKEPESYLGIESQKAKLAVNHIFDAYLEPLDATTLADVIGVHPSSLGRLFKRNTGFTLTEFINQVRINHAINLLVTTDDSILEVAEQSGFQNLSYFNRIFKQVNGCTPSGYKKRACQPFR